MRRLITLISAGRNRIVMIRREQPRTENANWVRGPYRTKGWRVLLAVCSDPVTCTVPSEPNQFWQNKACHSLLDGKRSWHRRRVPSRSRGARRREAWTGGGDAIQTSQREWQATSGGLSLGTVLSFGVDRNGPDEAQQFASHGRHDLGFLLVRGRQFLITGVQPPLCFPGNLLYLRSQ